MGIYGEYLNLLHQSGGKALDAERKKQLQRIRDIRKNDVLVIASDLAGGFGKGRAPVAIDYTDKLSIADQIQDPTSENVDIILETPGGSAEQAENIVEMLRNKFRGKISFIIPGAAMSAGTIMVMSGDEILMEPCSSLGPIDAQLQINGRFVSADACLTELRKIKEEVVSSGGLNAAYVPILQGISLGEIQAWENAQDFSFTLVSKWLAQWKFRAWETHSSTGEPVTEEEKRARAEEIANQLRDHNHWLTHGRSIRLADLKEMRLTVVDYTESPKLCDAIRRYYNLVRLLFENTSAYKVFETPNSTLLKMMKVEGRPAPPRAAESVQIDFTCPRCGNHNKIQANFRSGIPLQEGHIPFPQNNKVKCPNCNTENDLSALRAEIEMGAKKRIV